MINIKNKINSSRCIPRLDFKFQINQLNLIEVLIFPPKYSTTRAIDACFYSLPKRHRILFITSTTE